MLTRVEHVQPRKITDVDVPVYRHIRILGCRNSNGDVLPPRAVRSRPEFTDLFRRATVEHVVAHVVVEHLVVVPGADEGEPRVRGLQIRVRAVARVAEPEVGERFRNAGRQRARTRVLIDVVTEMQDQIEVLVDHVAICPVASSVEHLAVGDGEREPLGRVTAAASVRVRPTGLVHSCTVKR